ncbi:hypothetical protein SAMN06265337_0627 [Hymenobacter gelipurpurascens]|uniref:Uncharacterized protein n=1 Tax=Hymenobacter gelipurpurascens TaxID=89968 RepID=A0A212T838_9BACT|nr:hypothetical protein [Hymenobacter gelipurpurascens]SNC62223.1 hypothetical protein SAMN06265337_0627 [Hymenobacter gelipurpurascens]
MLEQNQPLLRFTLLSSRFGSLVSQHDPRGWEDVGAQLHRDGKLHGLTTEYTVELAFIKEAKKYLSQAYQLAGIEAEVELLIEIFDPNDFLWHVYYQGRLDFTGRSETATEFRCQAEKTGFTQKFLNRADTTVDLLGRDSISGTSLAALEPVSVELHSKAIRKRYEAVTPASPLPPLPDYVTDGESRFKVLYFGFGSPAIDDFGVQEVGGGGVTVPTGNTSPEVAIYTTVERGRFSFDINLLSRLRIQRANGRGDFDKADGEVYFRINNEQPVKLASFRESGIAGEFRYNLTAPYKVTRTLEIGDKVYFYGRLHVYDISGPAIGPYQFTVLVDMLPGSYFKMEAETQTDATMCPGLLAYEALDRLAQATTDSAVAFRSDFFGRTDTSPAYAVDGEGSLTYVTGGFQARGFPLAEKSLFATWQGLFGSLSDAWWLGTGIERLPTGQEVVRVEQASYFYSDEVVLELAQSISDALPDKEGTLVSNLVERELTDRYYNQVETGYRKWQAQQVNGLDEFNTRREWSLPLSLIQGTYSAVGEYITSGFYIESVRRNRYDATSTTDTGADNDLFLICVLRDAERGFVTERNQLFTELTGVFSPDTVYNARLSPARVLRRHAPVLAAGLQPQRSKSVRFRFGEGNNAFASRLFGEATAVVENADIPVADLGAPLWLNQAYSFTAPCTWRDAVRVLARPTGRVRFTTERGERAEGWILDFKHTLSRQQADFTLLRCHTNSAR